MLFLIDSKSRPVRGIFCQCPNSQHPIADFESKAVAGYVVDGPLIEDRVRLPNGKFGVDLNGDGIVTKGKPVRVFLFRNNGPEIDLK